MTEPAEITAGIETIIHEFVHERDDISVRNPVEINGGHCRWFLNEVLKYLGHPDDVTRHDAFYVHSWIEHDGLHYDAEFPEGISDPHELNVFLRIGKQERTTAVESSSVLTESGFD